MGDSDDDSVMYEHRDRGNGVEPENHLESEFDIDFETGKQMIRKRRCRKHPGEFHRYVCKVHDEVLCPKCLVTHKLCEFEPMGDQLSYDAKNRFRTLLTKINVRYNASNAVIRKVVNTQHGLDIYKDKQIDEINFSFDEIIKILDARRQLLIDQVTDLVTMLKSELDVDAKVAEKKRDEEGEVLKNIRNLQNFIFAVQEKINKRVMCKWKRLGELDRDFDYVDAAWEE